LFSLLFDSALERGLHVSVCPTDCKSVRGILSFRHSQPSGRSASLRATKVQAPLLCCPARRMACDEHVLRKTEYNVKDQQIPAITEQVSSSDKVRVSSGSIPFESRPDCLLSSVKIVLSFLSIST
jgi:hypothetical protein